jgi:hypothetical protein
MIIIGGLISVGWRFLFAEDFFTVFLIIFHDTIWLHEHMKMSEQEHDICICMVYRLGMVTFNMNWDGYYDMRT